MISEIYWFEKLRFKKKLNEIANNISNISNVDISETNLKEAEQAIHNEEDKSN